MAALRNLVFERMAIELLIQRKPDETPYHERFDSSVVTIGRDPASTLRFDMGSDLDVSTRHAEIHEHDGIWVIHDKDSTNGTFVNGARLKGKRALNAGDVVNLGRSGPELRVTAVGDQVWQQTVEHPLRLPPINANPTWKPNRTREWLVHTIETRMRLLKVAVAGVATGLVVLLVVGWLYVKRLSDDPQVFREVTAPAIWRANDNAVVLIEAQIPVTGCRRGCEGTGFSITDDGLIVTNRHVVVQQSQRATRVRVKFANTRRWLTARVVAVSSDRELDLALLSVEQRGQYPTVVSVSAEGPDLSVGSDITTIGFPLGTALKMEGEGPDAVARSTITTGSIGKVLAKVFQTDAFADHGSSGSPVFDRHGHAIGVVSGGARNPADKIVYVVPSNWIIELRKQVR